MAFVLSVKENDMGSWIDLRLLEDPEADKNAEEADNSSKELQTPGSDHVTIPDEADIVVDHEKTIIGETDSQGDSTDNPQISLAMSCRPGHIYGRHQYNTRAECLSERQSTTIRNNSRKESPS